jgi:hypothetical protein
LEEESVFNAIDAGKYLEIDIPTLNAIWLKCAMIKFGVDSTVVKL